MQVRYRFLARCHGSLDSTGKTLNQLTRNGNTPTGLVVCYVANTYVFFIMYFSLQLCSTMHMLRGNYFNPTVIS